MRDGYEDWEFHLRLAQAGYRGIEIAKPYYVYAIGTDGMLLKHSSQLHGKLWRTIRRKHAAAYRPWAILRLSSEVCAAAILKATGRPMRRLLPNPRSLCNRILSVKA